ncbi:hypothetical protein AGABI1DRAFT_44341 [Agaricus bisporus var. burnettii JB137-S8]|uniref:PLAC8-domain-containing protein n=1 Tax=Agaricus bisporus var. burnettii (strain JB137-S8 / ATCC MYA-4627 / FGSC 10392) TaxID=597362 RepID=K5X1V8_AGABU|nr:hypothetical protein AGABI2DRAFT_75267 [Agaricus bisporus var. bisporus H97]XP_007332418.1 uncharacterized protein AGABI1DRAFT_44341 [Agaricus bisporus var. burnettii JB137-S8]EKM76902.1 hypothetical protein AGABI1DRAFT_44341 [Agaricus bisporus var. burnettii JB137-S8]EKV44709.1 hypothetical protein AGABI2DRAFT_75267 [Agaricus bisporus var. bisporus H97]
MASAGGNRNAKNQPMGPDGREWSNGICDCCNEPGTCIKAWCCPCIVYASNKQRLEHLERNGAPDPEHGGGCCSGPCCLHASILLCFGAGFVLQFLHRGDTRKRYNIKGGMCGDCCTSFWCSPCDLTQEHQEIELEEKSFGGR